MVKVKLVHLCLRACCFDEEKIFSVMEVRRYNRYLATTPLQSQFLGEDTDPHRQDMGDQHGPTSVCTQKYFFLIFFIHYFLDLFFFHIS